MRSKGLDDAYKKVLGKKGFSVIDPDSRYEAGDEPSEVERRPDTSGRDLFKRKAWRDESGRLHRIGGPALILIDIEESEDINGQPIDVSTKIYGWYQHGKLHNPNGPALIHTKSDPSYPEQGSTKDSETFRIEYYINGKLHRDNGPALYRKTGGYNSIEQRYEWYNHGQKIKSFRDTGGWGWKYFDAQDQLHRDNGPAELVMSPHMIGKTVKWFKHGKLHRIGGPAEIRFNNEDNIISYVRYYINGVQYTKEEYEQYYKDVSEGDKDLFTDLGQTFD